MAKTCNSCKTDDMAVMPIAQHEKDQNRLMSIIKSLIAVIVILIVLLVGSNVGWMIYESQFETVETTETIIEAEQDGSGTNIVGGGDIEYGAESKNNEANN
jgi:hypothetical protein